MTRHVNWSLVSLLGGLIIIAATANVWLEYVAPFIADEAVVEAFTCPPEFPPETCAALEDLSDDNLNQALLMVDVLQGQPIPAPEDEANEDSLSREIDQTTVSQFSQNRVRIGSFTPIDTLRTVEGRASIWEIVADDQILKRLRFDNNFRATQGPDLVVILSTHPEPRTPEQVYQGGAELTLELGGLKGNFGSQNYSLPADFDPTLYSSVVIYSPLLEMVFGSAPLLPPIE